MEKKTRPVKAALGKRDRNDVPFYLPTFMTRERAADVSNHIRRNGCPRRVSHAFFVSFACFAITLKRPDVFAYELDDGYTPCVHRFLVDERFQPFAVYVH